MPASDMPANHMPANESKELRLQSDDDIVRMRQAVRSWAIEAGLSLVDQTKLVTAASELGRNTRIYGGGGSVTLKRRTPAPNAESG